MTWQGLVAIALALGAVIYCGHDPVCHDNLPYIGGLAATVVGIVGGLAKQEQQRKRKHRGTDPKAGDSGGFPRGSTPPLGSYPPQT